MRLLTHEWTLTREIKSRKFRIFFYLTKFNLVKFNTIEVCKFFQNQFTKFNPCKTLSQKSIVNFYCNNYNCLPLFDYLCFFFCHFLWWKNHIFAGINFFSFISFLANSFQFCTVKMVEKLECYPKVTKTGSKILLKLRKFFIFSIMHW